MKSFFGVTGLVIVLTGCASVRAEEPRVLPAELVAGVGVLNVFNDSADAQLMGTLEYRFDEIDWSIRPWVGLAKSERGTHFASAGLLYTYRTANGLRLSAGWAPTYYDRGSGQNLGSDLQFLSFGEIGYVLKNRQIVGVRFGHLSNGGFSKPNPGIETLELTYSLPLGR